MKQKTLRGAGATGLAQLLKFVLQFGSQIVMARLLDPAQFGLVAMVMPVLGLVLALNDFGLGQAVVQRAEITHRQVSALFWLSIAIGAGFTALAMLSAPLIAFIYGEPRTLGLTVASAALVMTTSLSVVPLALLNRQLRFVPLAVIEVLAMVLGLASGIAAAKQGAGAWSLVIMQAVNSIAATTMAWASCGWLPARPAREPGVGSMLRFGSHVMVSNFASYLSTSADNVIVGVVSGKVELGLYDRSYNLVVKPLWQLMAPVSRVAVPLLSRLLATPDRYARTYLLMLQLASMASVPGLIATILVAEPLILLLLGPQWAAMPPVFAWICAGGIAAALSGSTYWLFTSQARTSELMRYSVITAAISVASFAIGAWWGAVGVARLAALTFVFLQTPLVVWAATRTGPVTLAMVYGAVGPLVVAAAACALAAWALRALAPAWPAWGLILATFGTAYVAFGATLLLQPSGRRLLANARSMLASGPAPA